MASTFSSIRWSTSFLSVDTKHCLNLKEPGGRNPPPLLGIFCYISAGCYFFALKLHDFFLTPCARFKTIFKKIGPRVMTRRCVIERWVQRKTDQKLIFNGNYTQIVFFAFRIHFHYVLSYLFGLFGVRTYVNILWHTSLPKNATFAWKNSEKPRFWRFLVIFGDFRVFDMTSLMTSLWRHTRYVCTFFAFWYQWTREGHSYPLVPHTWCFVNRFPRSWGGGGSKKPGSFRVKAPRVLIKCPSPANILIELRAVYTSAY